MACQTIFGSGLGAEREYWLVIWFRPKYSLDGNVRYWGLGGLVPLLAGLLNFYPLYTVLGLNTCPVKGAKPG